MPGRELASGSSIVVRDRVFRRDDLALFGVLTVMILVAIVGFLGRWLALPDWRHHPAILVVLTALFLVSLAIGQFRWFLLPSMRRPRPLPARPDWRVGVATTFVPDSEPITMLEETVEALVAMDYPHETWVLDEGDDDRVKALCQRLGARHFARKGWPHYETADGPFQARSKHGNYNAWLSEIALDRYDIISAFDPDHVPDRSFLTSVLGYFDDPHVGYVQAPQIYYNTDESLIARGAAEEVDPFYSCVQPASDAAGHPIIIGCHNTHRSAALRQVGGFAPHQADDILLTFLYRGRDWRGVYVPRPLAVGLAPVDWDTYLRQQGRWARAVLDLKLRVYPRLTRSLPLGSRLLGLLHGASFLQGAFSWATLICLVLISLTFGVRLDLANSQLVAWSGMVVVTLGLQEAFQQRFYLERRAGIGLRWRAALLGYAKWPFFVWALIEVLADLQRPYATTAKVRAPAARIRPLWPHTLTIAAIVAAWAIGPSISGRSASPVVLACGALLVILSSGLLATQWLSSPEPYPGRRDRPASVGPGNRGEGLFSSSAGGGEFSTSAMDQAILRRTSIDGD